MTHPENERTVSDYDGEDNLVKDNESAPQVEGDRNQVIEKNFGTAIANVEGDFILNQSSSRAFSLHQLPADIKDFTGRKDEINQIVGHLKSSETVAISAVAGMPGVGKSSLVIAAYSSCAAH